MDTVLKSPTQVITRSDIPVGRKAISLDNSVYARLNEDVEKLKDDPQSLALRRLLRLMSDSALLERYALQFVVSQALYYDRRKDNNLIEAPLRLMLSLIIAVHKPDQKDFVMEWPVARVESMITELPDPIETTTETQDGMIFEMRWMRVTKAVDKEGEIAKFFLKDPILDIPLCVYDPGDPENLAATAFGFADFASVTPKRVADVCHVASHLRFAESGDILLAIDHHFKKDALANIGVVLMDPVEFLAHIDPMEGIKPIEINLS